MLACAFGTPSLAISHAKAQRRRGRKEGKKKGFLYGSLAFFFLPSSFLFCIAPCLAIVGVGSSLLAVLVIISIETVIKNSTRI